MAHERHGLAVTTSDLANSLSPQMREILKQIREEPFLVNLLPHLIKFVESKSSSLMQADETVAGDIPVYNLVLQVLQSVFTNKFFDSDPMLKTVIPILMNLTLCSKFHKTSSMRSVVQMKDFNASLLAHLISRFHQKYELKVGYADFLLKQMIEPNA